MRIYKPTYYEQFRCLADQCPDSCCKEWEVEIDDVTAAQYRNLPGALGERLRSVMTDDPQWGTVMSIENGRCPMWQQNGLCRIQAELGHDALCKTCRNFPRLRHDYGDFQELGLELSCPEAARLILSSSDCSFLSEDVSGGDAIEYDADAMAVLLHTRHEAIQILQSPKYTVVQSLRLLLYYGYQAQAILDGHDVAEFSADTILQDGQNFAIPGGEHALLEFYANLEILTEDWKIRLTTPLSPGPWHPEYRNLAQYFVNRYWLQAVSDYDLISRVKLTVVSCIMVHLLGGDFLQTAQAYSKEIENSQENVDAILDAAYTHPAFTDRMLLGLLT